MGLGLQTTGSGGVRASLCRWRERMPFRWFGAEPGMLRLRSRLALRLTHIPTEVADGVSFRAHEGDTGVVMREARHHDRHARASDQRFELITGSKRRRA